MIKNEHGLELNEHTLENATPFQEYIIYPVATKSQAIQFSIATSDEEELLADMKDVVVKIPISQGTQEDYTAFVAPPPKPGPEPEKEMKEEAD